MRAVCFLAGLLSLVSFSTARAADFALDKGKTLLLVRTQKDGMAARLAHNHIIWAKEFNGSVSYDPEKPEATVIKVDIATNSLVVDDAALKKKFGEDAVSDGDRADIAKNMAAEDQLHVAKFPTISFASTSAAKNADGTLAVKGNLTIRGVTKPVSFNAKIEPDGAGFKGHAEFVTKQSNFGYKPYSAMFGAVANKDDITFVLDLVTAPKG